MKKIIHVHVQRLRAGLPALIVLERGKAKHFSQIQIAGPCVVVSNPTKTRSPRTWIETHAEVTGS